MTTGAGYLVKADAGRELLPTIKKVLDGDLFVSGSLRPLDLSTLNETLAHEERVSNAPLSPGKPERAGHHEVVFYSDDSQLPDRVTKFIGDALNTGHSGIVIATEPHRNSLVLGLRAYGVDFDGAVARGRYIALDAAETMSTFMVDGALDRDRFMADLSRPISIALNAAKATPPRVAFFGEGADLLWTEGNGEAAVQNEKLCNELIKRYDVDILCGYSLSTLEGEIVDEVLRHICAEHSAVHRP